MRLLPLTLALAALAQQPETIFRTTTNLVVLDITARDKSGKDIAGLTKEDFTILEDGKPQAISVFEFQKLEGAPLPPAVPALATRAVPAAAPAVPARPQAITTASPGKIQYQDRRLMVLFFDFSSMGTPEQLRAQQAALKFLNEKMTSTDMVAIMTFGSQLEVKQDFTSDRDRLTEVIKKFNLGDSSELAAMNDTSDSDTTEDTGAAFTADDSEFNIFNTDRKLSALETAAKMLSGLPEKKALVYFSSGVGKTGVENQSQLRSTVNAAVRSNVSFYPVDARGLVAQIPGGDASHASSGGSGIFTGGTQRQQQAKFQDQQETLETLAADTGGKALLDSNDLGLGIVQAQQDVRSYYIVGYYSTNGALDGRYRRIQVKLQRHAQAKLDYRSGYFGGKQFGRFSDADKEHQLEEALMLGDPITDLPLAIEVNYFRLTRDRYFVPVAVKLPGSEIALARKGDTEFDFIGQVRDEHGRMAGSVRDGIRVKLDETGAAQLGKRTFQYDTGFTLVPGQYRLKFLARENQTGKMGTFETVFTVPNLTTPTQTLRVSSVVWSSQREPLSAAVGAADRKKKLIEQDPLVDHDHKLIPSITRVFRKDHNLYVYLEVYDPGMDTAAKKPSVAATLSFYRGKVKAFESDPVRLSDLASGRGPVLPVRFQVPLASLNPGPYTCQVNVVDEIGRRFAFPRARMVLLPPQQP